jgi:hypothetical protein
MQTTLRTIGLAALLLAVAVGSGCKEKKPEVIDYAAMVPEEMPEGAHVTLNGEKMGYFIRELGDRELFYDAADPPGKRKKLQHRHFVYLRVNKGEWLSAKEGKWAIEYDTPCGIKRIPAKVKGLDKAYEKKAQRGKRHDAFPIVRLTAKKLRSVTTSRIYVDREGEADADIRVGKMKLRRWEGEHKALWAPSSERQVVADAGCAKSHKIKVNGKTLGKLEVGDKVPGIIVVSLRKDQCYLLKEAIYQSKTTRDIIALGGMGGPKEGRSLLRGPVATYDIRKIDYFLSKAPSSSARSGKKFELARADCP